MDCFARHHLPQPPRRRHRCEKKKKSEIGEAKALAARAPHGCDGRDIYKNQQPRIRASQTRHEERVSSGKDTYGLPPDPPSIEVSEWVS